MATGVYIRTPNMKTGLHMIGRTAWNKGRKDPNAKGRTFSGVWTKERQKEYGLEWRRVKRASSVEYRKQESLKTRDWQKRNPAKNSWRQYQVSANKRGFDFSLTFQELENLIFSQCDYCGVPACPINGIDRVDNTKGYIKDNCVPCCAICNKAKGILTVLEFKNWIIKLFNNINKIK